MFVRITRENALKDLQICKTEIVEIIDTGAVRQNLVTLCFVFSYKGKKEPPKMLSTKKNRRKSNTHRAQTKQTKKQKISYYLLHQLRPVL